MRQPYGMITLQAKHVVWKESNFYGLRQPPPARMEPLNLADVTSFLLILLSFGYGEAYHLFLCQSSEVLALEYVTFARRNP